MTAVTASLCRRVLPWCAGFAAALAGIVVVVATLIGIDGGLTTSAWNIGAASTTKWFIGSLGFVLLPGHLRFYVAHGVTRRQFLGGSLILGLATAAGFALLILAGFGVERLVYGAAGLMDGLTEPYPVDSAGTAIAVLVRAFLIYAAYICSGWLVAAAFYRYGTYGGMALIIPSAIPAVGAEVAFGSEWSAVGRVVNIAGQELSFGVSALLTLVLVVAGCTVVYRLGRSVAIRGKA